MITVLTFVGAASVHAEDGADDAEESISTTDDSRGKKPLPRPAIQEKRIELKEKASTTRANFEDKKMQLKADIDAKKMQLKENGEEKREALKERKEEMKGNASERIEKAKAKAYEHLSKHISDLEKIKGKIETRIAKIEATGTSTTQIRLDLATASTKLDAAKIAVNAVLSVEISSSTPKTSVEALKTATTKAKEAIREAHKAFMKIVGDLGKHNRGPRDDRKDRPATTTATTTATSTATTTNTN